jgi:hypothetical protein
VEFKGTHRLILSIALLQRSVAVEVEAALVKPNRQARAEHAEKRAPLQPSLVTAGY